MYILQAFLSLEPKAGGGSRLVHNGALHSSSKAGRAAMSIPLASAPGRFAGLCYQASGAHKSAQISPT